MLEKGFILIGTYFMNGGETYTKEDLVLKLENDLGIGKIESERIIRESVAHGFVTEVEDGLYTR